MTEPTSSEEAAWRAAYRGEFDIIADAERRALLREIERERAEEYYRDHRSSPFGGGFG